MNDISPAPRLKVANETQWYWLATLYGEQTEFATRSNYDRDLARRNRIAWNRWMAGRLDEVQRNLLKKLGTLESDLIPFSQLEKEDFIRQYKCRSTDHTLMPPASFSSIVFNNTLFDRIVSFKGYIFLETVLFRSADFKAGVLCKRAIFLGGAVFASAQFRRRAEFKGATFALWSNFSSASFADLAHFGSSRFTLETTFINAEFSGRTIFSEAVFLSSAPDFRGARLHEATEWHGSVWPHLTYQAFKKLGLPASKSHRHILQQNVYAYGRIKQEMERMKNYEDEQRFFRLEMRARRGLASRFTAGAIFNYLYDITSNYGFSIVRPILAIFILFFIGVCAFSLLPTYNDSNLSIGSAIGLSISDILSFLPTRRDLISDASKLTPVGHLVGALQAGLGGVFIFLLILGLRNNLRMK